MHCTSLAPDREPNWATSQVSHTRATEREFANGIAEQSEVNKHILAFHILSKMILKWKWLYLALTLADRYSQSTPLHRGEHVCLTPVPVSLYEIGVSGASPISPNWVNNDASSKQWRENSLQLDDFYLNNAASIPEILNSFTDHLVITKKRDGYLRQEFIKLVMVRLQVLNVNKPSCLLLYLFSTVSTSFVARCPWLAAVSCTEQFRRN